MIESHKIAVISAITFLVFMLLYLSFNGKKAADKVYTPLSEVRCSDLERLYDECETSANVDRCRKRYDLKIAMCYGAR